MIPRSRPTIIIVLFPLERVDRDRENRLSSWLFTLRSSGFSSFIPRVHLSLSFIYLSYAYARKLWNHARVSFKQINKRRSKRSGTSRFPFAIPHFFSNVRSSSGLFSHDITRTVYNRDWNRRVFISVQRSSSSSFFLSFHLLLFALVYLTQVCFFFFFFRKEKFLETVAP